MANSLYGVSQERIDQILALGDHVLRNRWITQTYWELVVGLRPTFGDDATWLSFAVWASRTAGSLISKDGPLLVAMHADEPEEAAAVTRVKHFLDAMGLGQWIDRVTGAISQYTADGNQRVFAELAPVFLGLQATLDVAPGAARDASEARLFKSVDPKLHAALHCYLEAAAPATSAKLRAELVLLANLEAVLHEQRRLDGPIRNALDAAVLKGLIPLLNLDWLSGLPLPLADLARIPVNWVRPLLIRIARRVQTDAFLTLRVRSTNLPLGDDLDAGGSKPLFPEELAQLEHPGLMTFWKQWDRTGGTGKGAGAENWAELADRMNYICTLFRARQRNTALFEAPYDAQELEDLSKKLAPARARARP